MKDLFGHAYEHHSQPLAPRKVYLGRLYRNMRLAGGIMLLCWVIGIVGYRYTAPMAWIDAIHNAAMILSGMGPVAEVTTTGGKIFSSLYALFSGVAFITNIGILLTPVIHRFFHRLHVEEK